MKLVTFSHRGTVRIGLGLENGVLDLAQAQPNLPRTMLEFLAAGEPAMAQARAALPTSGALLPAGEVTLLAPIPRPGKLVCMGHNYLDHTATLPGQLPEFPELFLKATSAVIAPGQAVVIPPASPYIDYEAEFCFVMGRSAHRVSEAEAMDYVAGYTLLNDVTARDYTKRATQWMLGKSFDTFAPLGPALVTCDEVPDPHQLDLAFTVNGEVRQHSNTRNLIFRIPFLVSYISQVMMLEVGDVVSTGTPSGSGAGHKPPIFLRAGDEMRITVEKIGELFNPVVAA